MAVEILKSVTQVAICVLLRDGQVLLGKKVEKEKSTISGEWHLPSGKGDEGEDLVFSLKREMFEELGVEIIPHRILHSAYRYSPINDRHYICTWFLCSCDSEPSANDDLEAVKWVSVFDMRTEMGDNARGLQPLYIQDELYKFEIERRR